MLPSKESREGQARLVFFPHELNIGCQKHPFPSKKKKKKKNPGVNPFVSGEPTYHFYILLIPHTHTHKHNSLNKKKNQSWSSSDKNMYCVYIVRELLTLQVQVAGEHKPFSNGGRGWLLHNFLKFGKNFNVKDRRSLETKISVL